VNDDALALAFRAGLPFVGLRDHEHDPALDHVIPPEAAAAAGVVALAASDDHVRLAVAHPAVNLGALAPYLGDRRVELAIASRVELEAIVGPPPPVEERPAVEEPVVEGEPAALEAEPEPEPEHELAPESEPETAPVARQGAQPEPVPPGEEPSWLEPPSRSRRVLRAMLIFILLLVIAGGALLAYLLTR
jgi:Type II secretion system (T2SS), protein E, N-terminal domain